MTFPAALSAKELQRYHQVVTGGVNVRSHLDLLSWLQGDLQRYLPHDILIAAWGDFDTQSIHLDVASPLAGVRSQTSEPSAIAPLLCDLFRRWQEFGRKPFMLSAGQRGFLIHDDQFQNAVGMALRQMRGAMVHGITDERASHHCLYVLFSARARYDERRRSAMAAVLPYIDSALRQITHLPSQISRPRTPLRPGSAHAAHAGAPGHAAHPHAHAAVAGHKVRANGNGHANGHAHANGHGQLLVQGSIVNGQPSPRQYNLSERESEIMNWVAMGKTNPEIAQILQISAFTVKNHMQRLFQKLNVANRAQAVSKLSPWVRHARD